MKRKLIILAAGITVMLAACNKEKPASPKVAPAKVISTLSIRAANNDRAANPLNPYDSIGVIHNQVMDVTCDYIQKTGDTTGASIRTQVAAFFKNRYGADIGNGLIEMGKHFTEEFPGRQFTDVPEGVFNNATEKYLNRIIAAIQSVKDVNGYDNFKTAVLDVENEVTKDRRLLPAEQKHILIVSAVARYSMSYWLQKVDTSSDEAYPMGFFHNLWKAINVAAADTCGAIDGIIHLDSPRSILAEASLDSAITSALM